MHRDMQQYVQRYETCQRYNTSQQQAAGKMLTQIAEAPCKTFCIDYDDPLPNGPPSQQH